MLASRVVGRLGGRLPCPSACSARQLARPACCPAWQSLCLSGVPACPCPCPSTRTWLPPCLPSARPGRPVPAHLPCLPGRPVSPTCPATIALLTAQEHTRCRHSWERRGSAYLGELM